MNEHKRWLAYIYYKTNHGTADVDHQIEELEEIADLVEHGPDWNTITKIVIVLNSKRRGYEITVEEAEKL